MNLSNGLGNKKECMKMKLGFVGGGNMAEAIIKGALQANALMSQDIFVVDVSAERLKYLAATYGVRVSTTWDELHENADVVLLAIKPQQAKSVLEEHRNTLKEKCIVSIMAGISTQSIADTLGVNAKILRVMPNTPALIGKGITVLSSQHTLDEKTFDFMHLIFKSLGDVLVLNEAYFHGVTALSGSGPAYVYMFIEALADAAVAQGLPRAEALRMATQTVYGAAAMVSETGQHPAVLKDMVCSPGGTTIMAVKALEQSGFRNATMSAVDAAACQSKKLSEN